MAVSLTDARQLSDEVLEALRLRAVRGCQLGYTETEMAELLGVSRETVSRWWSAYADDGPEALPGDRTGRPDGSGRVLADEQARRIQDRIDNHSPEELGIAAAVWSRKAVRDLIRHECGIDLPGSRGELRSRIEWFMSRSLHLPEHVRSYFRRTCVKYYTCN
jgi:transposase